MLIGKKIRKASIILTAGAILSAVGVMHIDELINSSYEIEEIPIVSEQTLEMDNEVINNDIDDNFDMMDREGFTTVHADEFLNPIEKVISPSEYKIINQKSDEFDGIRYSNNPSVDNSTISNSGCGPVALAMAIHNLTGIDVSPVDIAEYALENGFKDPENGTRYTLIENYIKDNKIPLKYHKTQDIKEAKNSLNDGGQVMVSMGKGDFTSGSHFILLVDYDENNNKIYVLDPNGDNRNYNKHGNTNVEVYMEKGMAVTTSQVIEEQANVNYGRGFYILSNEELENEYENPIEEYEESILAICQNKMINVEEEHYGLMDL